MYSSLSSLISEANALDFGEESEEHVSIIIYFQLMVVGLPGVFGLHVLCLVVLLTRERLEPAPLLLLLMVERTA